MMKSSSIWRCHCYYSSQGTKITQRAHLKSKTRPPNSSSLLSLLYKEAERTRSSWTSWTPLRFCVMPGVVLSFFKLMLRDWISECGMDSCMSCGPLYILEKGAIRGQKGHTPSQINELYTVSQLMLCIEASKMPPKVLDSLLNFYSMAVASSMSLSSPRLGTIPSYQPQVLMPTFSSLRLFYFWATLRLLPVRSECAQEHFKFRKQSKTHFSHECLIRSR